jgi:cyclic pyranopterin phosphate synthase
MQNSKRNLVFPGNALPEDGFVDPLVDSFCRKINYIRLAVTDRCNLRCRYCMPESGIPLLTHDAILRFEEIIRLVRQFVRLGIGKIRITGGEPFARGGLVDLIARLRNECPWLSIHITTNGVAASNHIAALKKLGVQGINLSLDTLDPRRFFAISRRNSFSRVWRTF